MCKSCYIGPLVIVDLPTDDPEYMEKLMEERGWGPVVLFVDE